MFVVLVAAEHVDEIARLGASRVVGLSTGGDVRVFEVAIGLAGAPEPAT